MASRTGVHTGAYRRAGVVAPAIASAAALVAAVLGVVLAVSLFGSQPAEITFLSPGEPARAGGLSLNVNGVEWLRHDMEPGPFPMPASMMTGMPAEGLQRLYVEVTLSNAGDGSRAFTPGDFHLLSASGTPWAPSAASFSEGTLAAGQAMNGGVFFDVAEGESDLHLVWARGGQEVHIPVAAGAPAHSEHDAAAEATP